MNSLKIIFDRDTWQEIFGSIQKNKVRTIITVIGVLWGIFIYIALSGSANGLDNGFEREFENIAMNSMFVWAQSTSMPYDGFKTGRNPQLKLQDAQILKNNVPEIQFIAPEMHVAFSEEPVHKLYAEQNRGPIIFMVTSLNTPKSPPRKSITMGVSSTNRISMKPARCV